MEGGRVRDRGMNREVYRKRERGSAYWFATGPYSNKKTGPALSGSIRKKQRSQGTLPEPVERSPKGK